MNIIETDLEIFTRNIEDYRKGDMSCLKGSNFEYLVEAQFNNLTDEFMSNLARIAVYFSYERDEYHPLDLTQPVAYPSGVTVVSFPHIGIIVIAQQHQKIKQLSSLFFYHKADNGNYAYHGVLGMIDIKKGIYDLTTAALTGDEDEAMQDALATIFISFLRDLNQPKNQTTKPLKNYFTHPKLKRTDFSDDRQQISYREIIIKSTSSINQPDRTINNRKSPVSHFRRGHIRELANGKRVIVKPAQIGRPKHRIVVPTYRIQ